MDVIPEILERIENLEKKSGVHPAPGATVLDETPNQATPEAEKPNTTPAAQQTRAARRAAAGAGSSHQYQ